MTEKSETSQKQGGNSNWRQFCCLQWKNYLLQKKKKIQTIFIVLLPIFPAIVSVFVRGHEDSVGYSVDEHTYDSFTLEPGSQSRGWTLTYAPNTTLVAGIMNRTATILGTRIKRDQGFASETALEEYLMMNDRKILGAIVFVKSNWVVLPKKISYKIRLEWNPNWRTDVIFPERKESGPRVDNYVHGPDYNEAGFLDIQKAVDLSLIAEVNPSFDPTTTTVKTKLKQYPYPAYREDHLIIYFTLFLPMLLLIGFIIIPVTICQEIVLEKENKFKDNLDWFNSTWFLHIALYLRDVVPFRRSISRILIAFRHLFLSRNIRDGNCLCTGRDAR